MLTNAYVKLDSQVMVFQSVMQCCYHMSFVLVGVAQSTTLIRSYLVNKIGRALIGLLVSFQGNPNYDSTCSVTACESGYNGDPKVGCNDIDECATRTHSCHPDADCTNYSGDYICKCKTGYLGDGKLCKERIAHFKLLL